MSDPVQILATYLHLARASERRQRRHVRDRLLVLSAVVATVASLPRIAAYCRQKILEHNPRHLLRNSPTVKDALQDENFVALLKQLQMRYSVEKAERLLEGLGIQMHNERATYYSDEEYAAAVLGVSLEQLDQRFGGDAS